jgi:hypothetical protein
MIATDTRNGVAAYAKRKKSVNLTPYGEEAERGLSNEQPDINAATERQNFWDYEGERWESKFKHDAESSFDYQGRPHRPSGFLRQCVETLCEHLYCPGPSRRWSEESARELLDRIYEDNLVDAVLGEADTLATLNGYAAIQIDAAAGDFAERPITYRLWGREQLAVWTDPDNANCPMVVCTVDKMDLRTRYRVWSDAEVWTYLTKKAEETAGGRVAYLESKEPHDYGCLPFTFIHYNLPLREFDVSCPGEYLHKAEIRIDNRLNALDNSINKHLNPIPVAEGVPAGWQPTIEALRFIRLPRAGPSIGSTGGYEPGEFARLYFLQPQVDVAGAWSDLTAYMNQAFRSARVPISASMVEEAPGVISGIALLLVEAPLFKRARKRRGIYQVYEHDLARRTLLCVANHYDMAGLRGAAIKGRMTLGWPQPTIPVPTPDALELLNQEVSGGFKSHLMAVQQWYGVTRDQAVELIKQIKADTDELAALYPEIGAPSPEADPDEEETDGTGPGGSGPDSDPSEGPGDDDNED